MKKSELFVVAFVLLFGAVAAPLTRAQVSAGSPVTLKAKTVKPPKVKLDVFKGEVVRMNTVSIIVRDPKNSYVVRTFTFSPELTKKLQDLIGRGGYQPGDTVTIRYEHDGSIAQEIKGKVSKPF